MKLKKFTKNKKQKRIVIGSIVGIVVLIGGISLYRTFAMYEEKRSFDVLNGTVPDFRSDVILALTVDGKSTEEIPTEDNNYAIQVDCDKGNGVWNREKWGLEISNIEKNKVKCNIEFTTLKTNSSLFNFDYKGKEDAISLPSGKYKLEVWGAQGGIGGSDIEQKKQHSGLGGYSKGEITLTASETLYINVGGQGEGGDGKAANTNYKGGYNGGGNGMTTAFGGGGATHIALVSGLLSTLEVHKDNGNVLIVAGGGGGCARDNYLATNLYSYGGAGGGYKGRDGANAAKTALDSYIGSGATQSGGGFNKEVVSQGKGSFGLGGNAFNSGYGGAGGGGGFYGGGGSSRHHAGAGGGSGYIGNNLLTEKDMWCYQCEKSDDVNTKTTSTEQTSEEPISMYAKQGNGFARITYLGSV